jgi:2-octaprenyl-6-methoxyphenol hydroxylase
VIFRSILQKLIAKKIILGLDFSSDSLIAQYNNLARQNSKKMVLATDLLNTIFEAKCLTISIARKLGLGVVNNISQLKKFFISNAGGFANKGGEG